jgi:hypothetical protein
MARLMVSSSLTLSLALMHTSYACVLFPQTWMSTWLKYI